MPGCRRMVWTSALLVTLAGLTPGSGWTGEEAIEKVCVARVQGTIGPATASYLGRAIGEAAGQGAQCLVIELDTPGGLLDSTKEIIQGFLRSPVPTVVYVSPPGAWAGSAGCFITMAADVAVMAPTTSIGAAHPVGISPGGEKQDDTMKQKLENFSSSYIEAVAIKHHRNAEWARASVRESAAITSDKALELNVIDFIAKDLPDLLKQIDGREVNGRTLKTARASIVGIPMTFQEKAFQIVAHPAGHADPDADRRVRRHRRIDQSRRDPARCGRVIALVLLHVSRFHPADERRWSGPDWRGDRPVPH